MLHLELLVEEAYCKGITNAADTPQAQSPVRGTAPYAATSI